MLDPVLKVIEGFSLSDRVDQNYPSCSFVVRLCDGFESLLACGVPYLHLDFDSIDIDGLDFKVDANGGDMRHLVLLVDVSEENVSFSDRSVSDDD